MLAGNDMWCGGSTRSTECPLVEYVLTRVRVGTGESITHRILFATVNTQCSLECSTVQYFTIDVEKYFQLLWTCSNTLLK